MQTTGTAVVLLSAASPSSICAGENEHLVRWISAPYDRCVSKPGHQRVVVSGQQVRTTKHCTTIQQRTRNALATLNKLVI